MACFAVALDVYKRQSRSYADAGKAAVLIITSATCATMVIGQATILAAKICFIILYNAAANKEIVRGIAYFPIRTPSPSRLKKN